jgi:hypothetical protein
MNAGSAGCPPTSPCRHGIVECVRDRGVLTCVVCGDRMSCERLDAALARTALAAEACRPLCDAETYATLERAFFRKRENLGR